MAGKPENDFPVTTNRAALEATIAALPGLKAEHSALVQHARSLASSLDDGIVHEKQDLKTHTEYRHVLTELLEAGRAEELDAYAKLMNDIAAAAKVS